MQPTWKGASMQCGESNLTEVQNERQEDRAAKTERSERDIISTQCVFMANFERKTDSFVRKSRDRGPLSIIVSFSQKGFGRSCPLTDVKTVFFVFRPLILS